MRKHFFTSLLLIVLVFFTACSASSSSSTGVSSGSSSSADSSAISNVSTSTFSGPSDAQKVLTRDEFSLFEDGKEKVSLKTDSGSLYILYMQQQNEEDHTTYETKRGLKLGDSSSQIIQEYPDVSFTYSVSQSDTSVSENFTQTAEAAIKNYHTLSDFLNNESNMDLTDNEYILLNYTQYVDADGNTYTQRQVEDKLGYKSGMTAGEYMTFSENIKKYDVYCMYMAVKGGKVLNLSTIFNPKTAGKGN